MFDAPSSDAQVQRPRVWRTYMAVYLRQPHLTPKYNDGTSTGLVHIPDTEYWSVGHINRTVYLTKTIVQELPCESRGGRLRLSVLTNLLVSVDVKNY